MVKGGQLFSQLDWLGDSRVHAALGIVAEIFKRLAWLEITSDGTVHKERLCCVKPKMASIDAVVTPGVWLRGGIYWEYRYIARRFVDGGDRPFQFDHELAWNGLDDGSASAEASDTRMSIRGNLPTQPVPEV